MNKYNFLRVSLCVPELKISNVEFNQKIIVESITKCYENKSSIIVFPELCITGYTCEDLFLNNFLIEKNIEALFNIAKETKDLAIVSIIGAVIRANNKIYNCAVVINKGSIIGIIPKTFLPNYMEFYEQRYFASGFDNFEKEIKLFDAIIPFGRDLIFEDKNNFLVKIGIEICEDLWSAIPPSSNLALAGANILCNLSASNALISKSEYRRTLAISQSIRTISAYLYVSSGVGESTKDLVFDGDAFIVEYGTIVGETSRFKRETQIVTADIDLEKLNNERVRLNSFMPLENNFRRIQFEIDSKDFDITRIIDSSPFVPKDKNKLFERCNEILNIQSAGLAKRIDSLPAATKCIIGVSGGLDSTLALLVILRTLKLLKKDFSYVIPLTMPGFGTSDLTYKNIILLLKSLNLNYRDIDIKDISNLMLNKIEHSEHDITYENIQARARTYLLMTIANKENGIVIGTGDLSELALGFCTYNGDHISMYNVNSSIPKTLVKFLVQWLAENEYNGEIQKILLNIVNQPISPELIPAKENSISQKTEDIIGPYELHDFFLYYFVRWGFSFEKILYLAQKAFNGKYNENEIKKWLNVFINRFFKNQWKRDCVPAGPKVGTIDLSPRGSWRMPSDLDFKIFLF